MYNDARRLLAQGTCHPAQGKSDRGGARVCFTTLAAWDDVEVDEHEDGLYLCLGQTDHGPTSRAQRDTDGLACKRGREHIDQDDSLVRSTSKADAQGALARAGDRSEPVGTERNQLALLAEERNAARPHGRDMRDSGDVGC